MKASYIVTVSGQYLSVAITLAIKWISTIMSFFTNLVTYGYCSYVINTHSKG